VSTRHSSPPRLTRQHQPRRQGQRGFALTEALVALAILGATLALIYQTMASGWGAVRRTGLDAQAVATAMARLETVGREIPLAEGATQGRDDVFSWKVDISRHVMPGLIATQPQIPAWWVKVEVTWQEVGNAPARRVNFTTLRTASSPR
jgi:prepilin-type N-terminal cleavage/methylation domain-containing protein